MPLSFAYGSNMDRLAMAARCPASRPLGLARLPRHRLAIMREGFLTVVPDPRRTVHGILWDVALADVPALDRYEEVGRGLYRKRLLPVLGPAGPRRALIYVGANAGPGRARPGYLETVLAAARSVALPPGGVSDLAALQRAAMPARTDGNPVPSTPAAVRSTRTTPLDDPGRLAARGRR